MINRINKQSDLNSITGLPLVSEYLYDIVIYRHERSYKKVM